MRSSFLRGVITGSVIGAAISMMAGKRQVEKRGILGQTSRKVRSRANRVLKGVTRTVNELIK